MCAFEGILYIFTTNSDHDIELSQQPRASYLVSKTYFEPHAAKQKRKKLCSA